MRDGKRKNSRALNEKTQVAFFFFERTAHRELKNFRNNHPSRHSTFLYFLKITREIISLQ